MEPAVLAFFIMSIFFILSVVIGISEYDGLVKKIKGGELIIVDDASYKATKLKDLKEWVMSVATCGHEVDEGISVALKGVTRDFKECVDHKVLCIDCLQEEYYERNILNDEINRLCQLAGFKQQFLFNYSGDDKYMKILYDTIDNFIVENRTTPYNVFVEGKIYEGLLNNDMFVSTYNNPSPSLQIVLTTGTITIRPTSRTDIIAEAF